MANRKNTFLLKRSNVAGKIPAAGDLQLGELALNTADNILYASGTTANSILPIGWDRVARTGDTMTGYLYAPSISATTISASTYLNLPSMVGSFLPLSGGTVYGPTVFSGGLTANTLNVTGLTQTSGITSTGGITFKQVTINSTYSATTSDYMIDVTGGTFTVYLPSAVGIQGRLIVVKNNGGGAVTVQPITGQNIDDKPFVILGETNSLQLASNGSNWVALGYNISTVNSSTGVFDFTGLTKVTSSTFRVAPVKGWIVDETTNPLSPQLLYVTYTGGTHTATYLNTATETWVYLTSGGTISQSNVLLTDKQRRQNIFLGKLGHADKTTIINAFSQPDFVLSPLSQLRDMFDPIGFVNEGIRPSANGINLSFNTSAGYLHGLGINFANDILNPNTIYVSGTSPCTFQYRTQTGGTASNVTVIDPTKYDVGGTITSLSGTKATNQRIYLVQNGIFRVQYGQTEYSTLAQAIAAIASEPFVAFSNFENNGILIGILSVLSSATDLTDNSKAQFFNVSKFGDSSGAAGGAATTTLQQAYNNSVNPEITTNSTLDALSIKNGTGNADNTTKLLEGLNTAGNTTSFIRADGYISGTTFQSNGFIANSNGLTATTVSATTYYNLPTDVFVTGATYSNNTFTYTNNTGGTFNVLFNTLTGLTVNGNTTVSNGLVRIQGNSANELVRITQLGSGNALIVEDSTNPDVSPFVINASGDTAIGLLTPLNGDKLTVSGNTTVYGTLIGSTISATTYQNLPLDIRVTGGTYSSGTATFTNNTGGTFNVTGFNSGGSTGLTASDYVVQGYLAASQTIPSNLDTILQFSDDYDPQNWWNASSYRFTPTIAGYYQITLQVLIQAGTVTNNQYNTQIRKNGSSQEAIWQNQITTSTGVSQGNNKTIYMNGTTDYIDFTVYQGNPGSVDVFGSSQKSQTFFHAHLLTGLNSSSFTASNLGAGTGIFAQKSGVDFQFKSLTSTGGTVTISNTSNTVNIEVVPASNFTGGTVTGATRFTNGLTANTFSATTYLNLPTDVRVTGGTYSTGTAIFTNNTGGTFSVTGFSTGTSSTDTYVTGSTYSNNTFTFTNNTGGTFNVLFNTVTGLTSTGTISSGILSATTYSNLPIDVTVTGGTYSTGTATFRNNTGGTFTVTGFNTGTTSGNGTVNYLPKWTGTTGLGNSVIQDNGFGASIGAAPLSTYRLYTYSPTGTSIYAVGSNVGVLGQGSVGLQGDGSTYGIYGNGANDLGTIGVYGTAGDNGGPFVSSIFIGGKFLAGGGAGTNYSVQLQDNTEGINKVLVSQTSDGKANWSSILSGLTAIYTNTLSATTITAINLNVTGSTQSLFSGSSSVEMVKIIQNGSGDAFVVEDVANGDASHFVINSSGNIAIGLTAPLGSDKLTISGNTGVYGTVTATYFVGDGSGLTNVTATAAVPYGLINAISTGNYLI